MPQEITLLHRAVSQPKTTVTDLQVLGDGKARGAWAAWRRRAAPAPALSEPVTEPLSKPMIGFRLVLKLVCSRSENLLRAQLVHRWQQQQQLHLGLVCHLLRDAPQPDSLLLHQPADDSASSKYGGCRQVNGFLLPKPLARHTSAGMKSLTAGFCDSRWSWHLLALMSGHLRDGNAVGIC